MDAIKVWTVIISKDKIDDYIFKTTIYDKCLRISIEFLHYSIDKYTRMNLK